MPDMYELFDHARYHQSTLPLNPILDEITFVRFAPIQVNDKGKLRPGVLPRDAVCPALMASTRQQAERHYCQINLDDLRGGRPLGALWQEWQAPQRQDFYRPVKIANAAAFLNKPEVNVDGKTVAVSLSPAQIGRLITQQAATVFVERDSQPYALQLVLETNPLADRATEPAPIQIEDVDSFLSKPEIKLSEGVVGKAELTSQNVSELYTTGTTLVKTQVGKASLMLTVATRDRVSAGKETKTSGQSVLGPPRSETPTWTTPTTDKGPDVLPSVLPEDMSVLLDDSISDFVLPNLEFVLYLPYRQRWNLLGYSRGELVQSVSLAPQQETTVEIIAAGDAAGQGPARVARQMAAGQSWRLDPDGDVVIPIRPVTMQDQKGLDFGDQLSDLNRSTHQLIQAATQKTSAWLKSGRKSQVVEVGQSRAGRRLHNPNLFQTLALDFFEVLASYRVQTDIVCEQARLCVLTPSFLPAQIDRSFILCYEGVLKDRLLSPVYLPGFEATHILAAYDRLSALKSAEASAIPKADSQPAEEAPETAKSPGTAASQVTGSGATTSAAEAEPPRSAQGVVTVVKALVSASPDAIARLANDVPRFLRSRVPDWLGGMGATEAKQYEAEWATARMDFHRWLFRKCFLEVLPGG